MKDVLIDASSAILLFKAGLFDKLIRVYRATMAERVYDELTIADYPGAEAFRRARARGALAVRPTDGVSLCLSAFPELEALGAGERDTIRQYIDGFGAFILIDDGKGAAFCKEKHIPYLNALLFSRVLRLAGRITEADFRHKHDLILDVGRYSDTVVDYVRKATEEEVAPFLP